MRQTRRKNSPVEYIIERVYDEESNAVYFIEIVCTCGWNVAYFSENEDNFWCEHCDRTCLEGLPTCFFCDNLSRAREAD